MSEWVIVFVCLFGIMFCSNICTIYVYLCACHCFDVRVYIGTLDQVIFKVIAIAPRALWVWVRGRSYRYAWPIDLDPT